MKQLTTILALTISLSINAQFTWNSNSTGTQSFYSTASGYYSLATGTQNTASGSYSAAMGRGCVASDYVSFVIGQYNSSGSSVTTSGSATAYDTDNTAFVIGNGTSFASTSDAFKVMFNGDATVGNDATIGNDLTVSGDGNFSGDIVTAGNVTVSSDIRLKKDIVNLPSTIDNIKALRPVSYSKKSSLSSEEYGSTEIGLIAQELQEVYPNMVSEDDSKDPLLSVSYMELIPVIIKGMQEQQMMIEEQQIMIEKQQMEIESLKKVIKIAK